MRGTVAYFATCTWLTSWEVRHDAYRGVIGSERLTWVDGGGVVDHLTTVADATARGDRGPIAAELAANCTGLPLDGTR